jgi:hypothetical protein
MKRLLAIFVGIVLLALFLATVILWPLSYWKGWQWRGPTRVFTTGAGVLQLDLYVGIGPYTWGPDAAPQKLVSPPPLMWRPYSGGSWAGFQWREFHVVEEVMSVGPPPGITTRTLTRWQAPYWALAVLNATLLAGWWFLWMAPARRARRWAKEGRCPRCGYDLRATPARCPECGTAR